MLTCSACPTLVWSDYENRQRASGEPRILGTAFPRGARRGNPDHEKEQAGCGIEPVSAGTDDSRASKGHRSCDRRDGKGSALGRLAQVPARGHARAVMVTFDTNVLVYATTAAPDAKAKRSRDLIVRGMQSGWSILLLQTLAEFSNVAIQAGIPIEDIRVTIDAWRAELPVQAAEDGDLTAALDAVRAHRLGFWDAMLWAAAQRAGVRHLLTEDLQDGFVLQGVRFVNPFERANDRLIDEILPPS